MYTVDAPINSVEEIVNIVTSVRRSTQLYEKDSVHLRSAGSRQPKMASLIEGRFRT